MTRFALRKRAFTLIELLVVIAIIAILAAILFPIFARARDGAWRSGCKSNLQQIHRAMTMYAYDWSGRLPYANAWYYTGSWSQTTAPPPEERWVGNVLKKYSSNSFAAWECPANPYKMYDPSFPASWNHVFYYNLFNPNPGSPLECPDPDSLAGQPMDRPDFTVYWMPDKNGQQRSWVYTPVSRIPVAWDQRRTVWDPVKNKSATDRIYQLMHYDGWNILFLDGHVKYYTEKDRSAYMPR